MKKSNHRYDPNPQGVAGFRISIYSERIWTMPPAYGDVYGLFFMKKGTLLFGINEEEFYIKPGEVVFIYPGEIYSALIDDNTSAPHEFHFYSIFFDKSIIGDEMDYARRFFEGIRINRHLTMREEDWAILSAMRKWDILKEPGWEMNIKANFLGMLAHIINTGQYTKLPVEENKRRVASDAVQKVTEYIDNNYREKLEVTEIATQFGYSVSHMHKIFKTYTGVGIVEYINKVRILAACRQLMYTDKKVTDIALECGFDSPKYFSELFTKKTGMSPLTYRRNVYGFTKFPDIDMGD